MRTMKTGLITLILLYAFGGSFSGSYGVVTAHSQPSKIQCDFGACSAEIIQNSSLEVTCENRSIYKGPYVLNTSARTIRIESPVADGPRIMTQSFPTTTSTSKAILFLSGQSMAGSCDLVPAQY